MWKRIGVSDGGNTVNSDVTSGGGKPNHKSANTVESTKRKVKAKYMKKRKVCERKVLRVPCATYPRFYETHPPRGRQTLCNRHEGPIIPDKFRIIHSANGIHQLENLLIKQNRYSFNLNYKQQQLRSPAFTSSKYRRNNNSRLQQFSLPTSANNNCRRLNQFLSNKVAPTFLSGNAANEPTVAHQQHQSLFALVDENLQREIKSALHYNSVAGFQWHLDCLQRWTDECSRLTDEYWAKRNAADTNKLNNNFSGNVDDGYISQSILNYKWSAASYRNPSGKANNKISISIDNHHTRRRRCSSSMLHSAGSDTNTATKVNEVSANLRRLNLSSWDLPLITLTDYSRQSPNLRSYVINDTDPQSV